ncbi:MAG: epoxyqueuosine reductase QueH [Bacteroidales bacterium]|nr:epoxyqueuosine reductase QueH [Bacteroidales bacterium]
MEHFEGCTFKPELPEGCDLKRDRILLHCCCGPCSTAILEWMVNEGLRPGLFFSNSNIVPFDEYVKRRDELARYAATFGLEVTDDEYDHDAWLDFVKSRCVMKGSSSPVTEIVEGPERGPRCIACFEFRLRRAAEYAVSHGYDILTTTLASSRWKVLSQVDEAGRRAVASLSGEGIPPRGTATLGTLRGGTGAERSEASGGVEQSETSLGGIPSPNKANEPRLVWWPQNWRKGGLQERRNFLIKSCALYNQTWCGCEFSQKD